jgi:hypothetical protein
MRLTWLSILLIGLFSCTSPKYPARQVIEIHADPEFTVAERALIGAAVDRLEQYGIRYLISYDATEPGNRLRRMTSDSPIVLGLDIMHRGTLFGATTLTKPFRIYLVADRLESSRMWLHVALHELSHGAGADHVADPRAVMFQITRPGVFESVWLGEADLAELSK